jgi:hypothetical protein
VTEKWTARQGEEDLSVGLVRKRADMLLNDLLDLKAESWLRPGHAAAEQSLLQPVITFSVYAKEFDDNAELKGIKEHTLSIGRFSKGETSVYYGRLSPDDNPFLLRKETAEALASDLFELE